MKVTLKKLANEIEKVKTRAVRDGFQLSYAIKVILKILKCKREI